MGLGHARRRTGDGLADAVFERHRVLRPYPPGEPPHERPHRASRCQVADLPAAGAGFAGQAHAAGVGDRKSTRLKLQSHHDLVCRLLLEKKNSWEILSYVTTNVTTSTSSRRLAYRSLQF